MWMALSIFLALFAFVVAVCDDCVVVVLVVFSVFISYFSLFDSPFWFSRSELNGSMKLCISFDVYVRWYALNARIADLADKFLCARLIYTLSIKSNNRFVEIEFCCLSNENPASLFGSMSIRIGISKFQNNIHCLAQLVCVRFYAMCVCVSIFCSVILCVVNRKTL